MIAFFSESKAITIHINNFNEQYIDIAALIIIWSIMLISLFYMIKFMKEKAPTRKGIYDFERTPSFNKSDILYGINFNKDEQGFIDYISKSSKNLVEDDNN